VKFVYNDGGRSDAGYKGGTRDCGIRAVAIATEIPYQEVYDAINVLAKDEKWRKKKKRQSNSRTGVHRKTLEKFLFKHGWIWVPTMKFGEGCRVHLKGTELPSGNLVVCVSKHYIAVIHGVVNDTFDDQRGGTRCVYGYYIDVRQHQCDEDKSYWENDAQNIPLAKVCAYCREEKLRGFRPEILSGYSQSDVSEPIEPEVGCVEFDDVPPTGYC